MVLLLLLISRLFTLVGAPVVTTQTSQDKSPNFIKPTRCIEPRPLIPRLVVSRSKNFIRLDLNSLVEPVGVTRRSSRLGCARRCVRKQRCNLYRVDREGGDCQLFMLSLTGDLSNCTARWSVCYLKLC